MWHDTLGFASADQASSAVALLVANLEACTTVAWQIQPIGQSHAMVASSANAVIWIHQKGNVVSTLAAPTTDGPPPQDVQVEVAAWMAAYTTRQQQN